MPAGDRRLVVECRKRQREGVVDRAERIAEKLCAGVELVGRDGAAEVVRDRPVSTTTATPPGIVWTPIVIDTYRRTGRDRSMRTEAEKIDMTAATQSRRAGRSCGP
ncbi:hypothetical protein [Rhodococcus sp. USK13]|uniref:hypothetical protein n=1 Tax=Rhodococcus sp. USK13 TaxID=2806442 RepID=UPI001BCC6FDD|nr:hypothetical protein [Rhodococcus sp. USK13]